MGVIGICWWRPLVLGAAAAFHFANAAVGQRLSVTDRITQCNGCHGADGNSPLPNVPSLAAQPAFFVLNQLILMREGVRRVEAMVPFVKDLTDDDIDALAKHYLRLTPKPSNETPEPLLVKRGAELAVTLRCGSCHLPTLAGQDQIPRLAKQRIDYMIGALKEFRDDKRAGADTLMSNVVRGLPDRDLAALAHYSATR